MLHDLAAVYGADALAVVLTGMGDDGSAGASAVVAVGGQIVVQDADSSAVDGMPRRVRDTGLPVMVAEPADLARSVLAAFDSHAAAGGGPVRPAHRPVARPAHGSAPSPRATPLEAEVVDHVREVLITHDDVDLHMLRDTYLARRIASFARREGLPTDERLPAVLARDERLRHALVGRLHVHVTSFFRDIGHWDAVAEVIGDLPPRPRVWSAGCADGSEAYSLAVLCVERGRRPRVWATDVDDSILDRCRKGTYRTDDVQHLPVDLQHRYFRERAEGGVRVRTDLRRLVTVEQHDALHDPLPDEPFDLVACRNLVIYLGAEGRDRLYGRLAGAVRPGGVLFTGAADSFHDADRYGFRHLGGTLFRRVAR
jgi:chemotaxis methyl-accepting protein methylase